MTNEKLPPAAAPAPASAGPDALARLRQQSRLTLAVMILLGGSGVAWGTLASISGAVLTSGALAVESNVKKVQHPTGGVVGKVHVRDGDQVKAGQLVVTLDDTVTRANLAIVMNDLVAMRARLARLRAERDQASGISVPDDLVMRAAADAETRQILSGETALFDARRLTREGQRAQMLERIDQLKLERKGLDAQAVSLRQQRTVAQGELQDMEGLLAKNLVQRPRVTQLQREVIRIDGSIGDITARLAQAAARVAEAELQLLQLDRDAMTENARETRETEGRIVELNERRITAEDQLRRVDIRSPQDGVIHQLAVHTVGGVIAAGDVIAQIVPTTDALVIETKVQPQDIDQIAPDQVAYLRFTAFNARTTPELTGRLARISPELTRDPQSGQSFYTAIIRVDDSEMEKLKGLRLIPGMPVEAHLATTPRTVASFITKPLTDLSRRAMREK
jgi:HlyD family secretion protein